MRILIAAPVPERFLEVGGGVEDLERDGQVAVVEGILAGFAVGNDDGVGFGRRGQIGDGLGHREHALGHAHGLNACMQVSATWRAWGSAFPMSSLAKMRMRRKMKSGSSPPSSMRFI